LRLSGLFQLISGHPRSTHFLFPLPLALALLFMPFKFAKAALGIHQAVSYLLEGGDLLRNNLAGARVNLATCYIRRKRSEGRKAGKT
jgi:hypothetical protein